MSWNDSWDNEPAPASETWDSWDTPAPKNPTNTAQLRALQQGNVGKGFGNNFNNNNKGGGCWGGKGGDGGFGKGGDGGFGKGGDGGFGKGGDGGFGKGNWKGCNNWGKGKDSFGGKGDFGQGDGGFGKNNFGKGKASNDFNKGFGKDNFSKGFGKDDSFQGGKGKDNFNFKGNDNFMGDSMDSGSSLPPFPTSGMDGKGNLGFAKAGGQFGGPPMGKGGMMPQKGFDGGKGGFGKSFDGGKGPPLGMQPSPTGPPFQPPPPGPPPGMGMPPFPNGNFPAFGGAPGAQGMAPELLALTEAENMPMPPLDAAGVPEPPPPKPDGKKPRLFLLLTRLAPDLKSEHMQQILEQCGEVQAFRRARDPSGQPLSFGFAQFGDPEAAWKASTCISKLVLCGMEIKVLLEEATEAIIQNWRNAQQAALKVASTEELEWELERKSVSCKSAVEAKVEEIYGSGKGGAAASKRRQELRQKEQARILRVRKRKAWREDEFAKELSRVESSEKRQRNEEKARDGMDRKKEELHKPKPAEEANIKQAKLEETGDDGVGPLALVTVSNDNRVLCDLVDRIQAESRQVIFNMELDTKVLREEKSLEKKLRPWLERKIDIFMGGPQADLVEYALRRVVGGVSADSLIADLSRYLDDNAEALVERMWRMLIFELMRCGVEPKRRGAKTKSARLT